MEKLTLECVDWCPLRRNTLRGFAAIRIPAMRLTIRDVAVHAKGDSHWAALPGKPQITCDGAAVRDQHGKIQYVTLFDFDTDAVRRAFSHAAIAAVLALYPHALAEPAEATT